jgi:hypothetical protein
LKAWWALWLPETEGRWAGKHREEKQTVLRMEFKTFLNAFVKLPCQVLKTGRKLVYRLLDHVVARLRMVTWASVRPLPRGMLTEGP